MKNFDSRTYSINDFLEWQKNSQLELSPRFQRRSVWSPSARSFLMDTILRGKPIPKVFIRQRINPTTQKSIREVVDGQQRLRTILSYVADGFVVNKKHNAKFGGSLYSQLSSVDTEIQTHILNYEISVDLLVNMPDEEVLDVFSRLNSYATILNDQEKINATHFGPFKIAADETGRRHLMFWETNRILSEGTILRMGEVALAAELLIAICEGIKSKKQMKAYYKTYEDSFSHDPNEIQQKFDQTIDAISAVFSDGLSKSEFRRVHVFYTLFTTFYHCLFGLKGLDIPQFSLSNAEQIRNKLSKVEELLDANAEKPNDPSDRQFLDDCRRATTDGPVRVRRTKYLLSLLSL